MDKNDKQNVGQMMFELAKQFPHNEVSWRTQRVFQSKKDTG